MASMIALEHGAQQVWRRTVVSPIGACIMIVDFILNEVWNSGTKIQQICVPLPPLTELT
jgi:hypothetical protein